MFEFDWEAVGTCWESLVVLAPVSCSSTVTFSRQFTWSMFVTNSQFSIRVSVASHIKMNPQELMDKLVSWRGRDRPGTTSGYKCTSTLTTLNTPLPDTRGVSGGCCDKNVFTLGDSLIPCCCAWDELSFSDSEPSPRQFGDNSFGRISQFRPSDCQWDRCTRIGSSYSTAPRALEVIKQLTSDP